MPVEMRLSQLKDLVRSYRGMSGDAREYFKERAMHSLMLYKESIDFVERRKKVRDEKRIKIDRVN